MEHKVLNLKVSMKMNGNLNQHRINGKDYQSLKAVMLKEGVFTANQASNPDGYSTFYSGDVLSKSVPSWNGRGVTIDHPENGESANTISNIESSVGFVLNTEYNDIDRELKADIFIDQNKCQSIIESYKRGETIDVSTGVWGTMVSNAGKYEETNYDEYYESLMGDHLALLPNGTGACSGADGCGLKALSEYREQKTSCSNKNTGKINMSKEKDTAIVVEPDTKVEQRLMSIDELMNKANPEAALLLNDAFEKREKVIKEERKHRSELVDRINAFKKVEFCHKFLDACDVKDIKSIKDLVDIADTKDVGTKKESISADFSMNSSKVEPDSNFIPIREIPIREAK